MGNIIQRFFSLGFSDDDDELILMYDKLQKLDDFDDDDVNNDNGLLDGNT